MLRAAAPLILYRVRRFAWAYFFNSAYAAGTVAEEFTEAFATLPSPPVMGEIDYEAWAKVAETLIPLCRSQSAQEYALPAELFPTYEAGGYGLPGVTLGEGVSLGADPSCALGVCPSSTV